MLDAFFNHVQAQTRAGDAAFNGRLRPEKAPKQVRQAFLRNTDTLILYNYVYPARLKKESTRIVPDMVNLVALSIRFLKIK